MSDDNILMIAKSAPESMTKAQWYEEIFKRSERQRPVGESQAIAFTRFIEKYDDGQILYRAYRSAPGPDWQPPQRIAKAVMPHRTEAMSRLEKLAEETRANNPNLTKEQAFSKVLETPEGLKLYRADRNELLKVNFA
jgi:hypothetical protein